ncbi:hypothetical protein SADUNF_Sadunf04G0047100 [Salix dunnii]|uniref:Uncharacterized protein n=1 Tax=Salix dunnii TaxID=1413687 RepID=A0A835N3W3_9ROSI|nr:hypothetical protein SADUNF_Sadunf04G0047100 [Salix dunnii]
MVSGEANVITTKKDEASNQDKSISSKPGPITAQVFSALIRMNLKSSAVTDCRTENELVVIASLLDLEPVENLMLRSVETRMTPFLGFTGVNVTGFIAKLS